MSSNDGALGFDGASRPLAIAGFMGVGKSSIGRATAEALRRPFFDSDAVVVERMGRSIVDLFRSGEQERFRACEAEVISELISARPPAVISLGGGALGDPATLSRLLDAALLVHLHLPWPTIESLLPRLRRGRPLLLDTSDEEIHALYAARAETYARCPVQVELRREGVLAGRDALLAAIAPFGVAVPIDEA